MKKLVNCPWCGEDTEYPRIGLAVVGNCVHCHHQYIRHFTFLHDLIFIFNYVLYAIISKLINPILAGFIFIVSMLWFISSMPVKMKDYKERDFVLEEVRAVISCSSYAEILKYILFLKKYNIFKVQETFGRKFYLKVNGFKISNKNILVNFNTLPLNNQPKRNYGNYKLYYKNKYFCDVEFVHKVK